MSMGGLTKAVLTAALIATMGVKTVEAQWRPLKKGALNYLINRSSIEHIDWDHQEIITKRYVASAKDRETDMSIDAFILEFFDEGYRFSVTNNMFKMEVYMPNDSTCKEFVSKKNSLGDYLNEDSEISYAATYTYKLRDSSSGEKEWVLVDYLAKKGFSEEKEDIIKSVPFPLGKDVTSSYELYERIISGEKIENINFFVLGYIYHVDLEYGKEVRKSNGNLESKININLSTIPIDDEDVYRLGEHVEVRTLKRANNNGWYYSTNEEKKEIEIIDFKTEFELLKYLVKGVYDAVGSSRKIK